MPPTQSTQSAASAALPLDTTGEYAQKLLNNVQTNMAACEDFSTKLRKLPVTSIEINSCLETMRGLLTNSLKCGEQYHKLCNANHGKCTWRPGVSSLYKVGPGLRRQYEAFSFSAAHLTKSLNKASHFILDWANERGAN
jgi:hypothetical protein